MKPFELPALFTLAGSPLDAAPDSLLLEGNTCNNGGGNDNNCTGGGGHDNNCYPGSGAST